jgi:hypothetical protein
VSTSQKPADAPSNGGSGANSASAAFTATSTATIAVAAVGGAIVLFLLLGLIYWLTSRSKANMQLDDQKGSGNGASAGGKIELSTTRGSGVI